MNNAEILDSDLSRWEIGPFHPALPGAMMLRLRLDGEMIVSAEAETGFLHRGLEEVMEKHPWHALIAYADRLDPEGAAFGELVFCRAVEEIARIEVPARALRIRIILSELARVSSHLGYVARVALAAGSETMVHYVLRDREKVLDLFELLTGMRFSLNFLRYGGVSADVTEGFIERVLELCDVIRIRLKEYNDLFTYNHAFIARARGLGVITREQALEWGLTGPNARAARVELDARKAHPYLGYDQLDFESPLGRAPACDVHDRLVMRLLEIAQSLEILRHAAESVPAGDYLGARADVPLKVPAGEAYSRVESARGLLGCHLVSDGGERPGRVQFRAPSLATLSAIPAILPGARLQDLPLALASLDLSLAEVDR